MANIINKNHKLDEKSACGHFSLVGIWFSLMKGNAGHAPGTSRRTMASATSRAKATGTHIRNCEFHFPTRSRCSTPSRSTAIRCPIACLCRWRSPSQAKSFRGVKRVTKTMVKVMCLGVYFWKLKPTETTDTGKLKPTICMRHSENPKT